MERIPMIQKDLKRLEVLKKVKEDRCKQVAAGQYLGITTRQFRRLMRRFEKDRPKGIISRKIGIPGNRRLSPKIAAQIIAFCQEPDHSDFGPWPGISIFVREGVPLELSQMGYLCANKN